MTDLSTTDAAHDALPMLMKLAQSKQLPLSMRLRCRTLAAELGETLDGIAVDFSALPKVPNPSPVYCPTCGLTTSHWADCPEASA